MEHEGVPVTPLPAVRLSGNLCVRARPNSEVLAFGLPTTTSPSLCLVWKERWEPLVALAVNAGNTQQLAATCRTVTLLQKHRSLGEVPSSPPPKPVCSLHGCSEWVTHDGVR